MEIQSFFSVALILLIIFTHTVFCVETCNPTSCSPTGPIVRFPFRLSHQPRQCGYSGFDLSCNNQTQLIINLNSAGDFIVTHIDYILQTIYIKPVFCPPTRLDTFNPSESPFDIVLWDRYLFFNCSSAWFFPGVEVVNCVPGVNGTVVAVPRRFSNRFINRDLTESCQFTDLIDDVLVGFAWVVPSCRRCEIENGTCGYTNVERMETGCSLPLTTPLTTGLSTAAKYGIVVGAGLPGILLLICLASYAKKKMNDRNSIQLRQHVQNLPTTTISLNLQPPRLAMGLDKLTIDSYPMIVLGESKRLPKPSDSTCAICLSEYQPNDTLRTVPECNHYFHSNCIDEWLKLNATCPVCRNFPEGSSGRAATDPLSSSSSPTSLFSN